MTKLEKIQKSIEVINGKIEHAMKSKAKTKEEKIANLRIWLKKLERRAKKLAPVDLNMKLAERTKVLEWVTKKHDDSVKKGKKIFDPYVHSFRKKIKKLNRQIKRINKRIKPKT